MSQKNATTLKRYTWIDFDDSRIEFACFSFRVGLHFLSTFRLFNPDTICLVCLQAMVNLALGWVSLVGLPNKTQWIFGYVPGCLSHDVNGLTHGTLTLQALSSPLQCHCDTAPTSGLPSDWTERGRTHDSHEVPEHMHILAILMAIFHEGEGIVRTN